MAGETEIVRGFVSSPFDWGKTFIQISPDDESVWIGQAAATVHLPQLPKTQERSSLHAQMVTFFFRVRAEQHSLALGQVPRLP